jgi:cell division protein FtsN
LFLSDSAEVVSNSAALAEQEDKEEFSFPDTFEPDGVFPDGDADGQAAFLNEFDGDESSLISAHPAENRRNPALLIVLLIVLLAGGGYFAIRFITSGSSDKQPAIKQTVVPLSAIKAEEKQQAEAQKPDARSVVPEKPAPAGQVPSAGIAAADAQPPSIAEITAEPLSSAAPAEMMSPAVSRGPAPVAGKDIAAVPAIGKPVEPSQAPMENTDVPSAVPVQDSIGLQSVPIQAPAAVQPKKPVADVTAPFYTVHVGSYRNRDTAASESARISAKGHDAFVERADLGPRGIWFRVKVGRFKTRAEAESLKAKIHKVLVPDSVVVMNSND